MIGLILVALLPFAALGIMLGHLLNVDSIGPATGGGASLLAFLGGTWFPLKPRVPLRARPVAAVLLARPGGAHVGLTGQGWPARGWIVVGVWAAVLSIGAPGRFAATPSASERGGTRRLCRHRRYARLSGL